ncbi:MAG: hypothetical protein JSS57_00715 [Proteobacteria bacterium]|nr:hypothetical protein [Pseudomonadota bacterium]
MSMSVAIRVLAGACLCSILLGNPTTTFGVVIDVSGTAKKYEVSAQETGTPNLPLTLVELDQKDQAAHIQWQRDYERRGWEWHLFSTQLLFCIVMGIVAFGLWITYLQFKRDYTGRARAQKTEAAHAQAGQAPAAESASEEPAPPATTNSTIKIGPAGMEMTSQIVGLLVLALSVAFFYFYVKEVYPMREIERAKVTPSASTSAEQ